MSMRTNGIVFIFVIFMVIVCVRGIAWFSLGEKDEEEDVFNPTIPTNKGPLEETRKKKGKKFMVNLLLALFIIKGVLAPIAFKIMAVMSSVSVVLSFMSLIISSLAGYSKLATKHTGPTIKFIQAKDPWSKDEDIIKSVAGLDYLGANEVIPDLGAESLEHYHYHYQK